MNQLPNTIQTSEEIIEEAVEDFKTDYPNGTNESGITNISEAHYIIGYLKQHYDTLLKSISEDTRDKFLKTNPDDPTYEEMIEQHEDFKEDNSNVPEVFTDIFKQFGFQKP